MLDRHAELNRKVIEAKTPKEKERAKRKLRRFLEREGQNGGAVDAGRQQLEQLLRRQAEACKRGTKEMARKFPLGIRCHLPDWDDLPPTMWRRGPKWALGALLKRIGDNIRRNALPECRQDLERELRRLRTEIKEAFDG